MRTQGPIKPGTLVLLKDTLLPDEEDDGHPGEYGRVIHSYQDKEGDWHCYTAFFGESPPPLTGRPDKPYVLHYYTGSLRILEEDAQVVATMQGIPE